MPRARVPAATMCLVALLGFASVMGGCRHKQHVTSIAIAQTDYYSIDYERDTAAEPSTGDYRIENESDLEAIAQHDRIAGHLRFTGQDWLTDIDMPALTAMDGLFVFGNDALTNLDGLSSLTSVRSYVDIRDNDALTSLDALSNLTTVDTLAVFWGNDALTSLGMPALTTVGGHLHIWDNASMASLDMPALTTVAQDLTIEHNAALTSFDMSALTTVGGDLEISWNNCLSQAEAEAFAAGLSVGREIDVYDNGADYPCN